MDYESVMKRVLSLALKGSGRVSPNPRVGAIIMKNNEIISEAYHEFFGRPHAEVNAIRKADIDDFSDCTIFVNLEPCSHYGKTPPCAELLIEKKFKKVVIGMKDPNPLVSGKGFELLKNAGIEVITGILEEECKWINRFFIKNIVEEKPYVIIKVAQSINGCIATSKYESKWITGEESRKRTHALRAQVDAVLVGRNTALSDNPELNVRLVNGISPRRVIIDTRLSLPLDLKIFKDELRDRTIIICSEEAYKSHKANVLEYGDVEIVPSPLNDKGMIDLNYSINELYSKYKISSILVEGGAKIYSEFINIGLADELDVFQAPLIIGSGINAFENYHTNILKNTARFTLKSISKSGVDIHSIYIKQ